jgi:hypothetical protein
MNVAIQRIRDYLLSEETQLSLKKHSEAIQQDLPTLPEKKVTVIGKHAFY